MHQIVNYFTQWKHVYYHYKHGIIKGTVVEWWDRLGLDGLEFKPRLQQSGDLKLILSTQKKTGACFETGVYKTAKGEVGLGLSNVVLKIQWVSNRYSLPALPPTTISMANLYRSILSMKSKLSKIMVLLYRHKGTLKGTLWSVYIVYPSLKNIFEPLT